MLSRTKLICTIGPSCNTLDRIIELIKSGMNVARLNFSHGTHEEHKKTIENLKEARRLLRTPLAIMLDTKGPEIRVGKIKDGSLRLPASHQWLLVKEQVEGDLTRVTITPETILDELQPGMKILFDDGYISSKIIEKKPEGIVVEIENEGIIRSGKGVNIPNASLNLPAMTQRDIDDIRFGCLHDIDIIAASFVRSAEHVLEIKRLLQLEHKSETLVIAKIENAEGIHNFDSIVQAADGVMIARGDLGVEVPLSHVPKLQKMMIRKSYLEGKPSVTATQMLESMINNPRPTRAEASDVANAIYDSTSCVMLSGETAIGKYPFETVQVMRSIVMEAESDFDYRSFFDLHSRITYRDVPSSLTLAAVKTAYSAGAKAIFAFTSGGSTARLLSRLRPSIPIVAMTHKEKCYHQLAFNWGVIPVLKDECTSISEAFDVLSSYCLENNIVEFGDLVVVTAGSPFGISGTTNMMIVENIGDVLVRGNPGEGHNVHGNITIILSSETAKPYTVRNKLLVLGRCDDTCKDLIKECLGVILQNHVNDYASEEQLIHYARQFNKPYILRADGATRFLKEGLLVTLNPEKALVYKGVVL